ncbi:MAG: hypothetical protein WBO09_08000 [Methylocystis silviterrae]
MRRRLDQVSIDVTTRAQKEIGCEVADQLKFQRMIERACDDDHPIDVRFFLHCPSLAME